MNQLHWLIDDRASTPCMTGLLGREPLCRADHAVLQAAAARAARRCTRTNIYLRVQPGTCMAAWMALDDCDEENGCMQVVPGSHTWPVLCTDKADTTHELYRRHRAAAAGRSRCGR